MKTLTLNAIPADIIKLITEKISKRRLLFPARGQLKVILLINFLRLSKEVERKGKNNGASDHTLQLQEKIYEKPIQFCVLFYETTILIDW